MAKKKKVQKIRRHSGALIQIEGCLEIALLRYMRLNRYGDLDTRTHLCRGLQLFLKQALKSNRSNTVRRGYIFNAAVLENIFRQVWDNSLWSCGGLKRPKLKLIFEYGHVPFRLTR